MGSNKKSRPQLGEAAEDYANTPHSRIKVQESNKEFDLLIDQESEKDYVSKRPIMHVELTGHLDEVIRIPRSLNHKNSLPARCDYEDFNSFKNIDKDPHMSIYASVARHEDTHMN